MSIQNSISITVSSNSGLRNTIISEIEIKAHGITKGIKTVGIWDTGATSSAITKSTASKLGLKPIGMALVKGVHGDKPELRNVYMIDITIQGIINFVQGRVTECDELTGDQSAGMLIGMDVITGGDFAITNFDNKTVMSFRVPSCTKIDFVKEHNNTYPSKKVGRNQPCSCGSGKKYKHCHGR